MVMQYGMSTLGRVNYKEERGSAFLAGASNSLSGRQYSEGTAQDIDAEVNRIINESIERVRHILDVRKAALVALTQRLIEVESVEHDELKKIVEENSSGPFVVPGTGIGSRKEPRTDFGAEGEVSSG